MKAAKVKAMQGPAANAVAAAPVHVAVAIKALHAGTANAHQQQEALKWIVREAGGKAHFPYHPTDRDTAFALGRYFVADLIVGLINAELSSLRGDTHEAP